MKHLRHIVRATRAVAVSLLLLLAYAAQGQEVRLLFAGDLMGHTPQHKAALQADGSYDFTPCFRYVSEYIQRADLAVVNLEVTLAGKPYSGYPQFSSPDALMRAAQLAGFDVVTTANNHCMDRGRRGLERTLRVLDSMQMPHLGTYADTDTWRASHPLIVNCKGVRIALLCYTYGTNGIEVHHPNVVNMIDTVQMLRDLQSAQQLGVDFTVALVHWGIEYQTHANREQERLGRWLVEHGCNAVIGGHPHVVQNFTADAVPGDGRFPQPVIYSMGNLVSNQRDVNCDGGIMVQLTVCKSAQQTSIVAAEYLPYWVHRGTVDGLYQYYIVPSNDAALYPEQYQISAFDIRALRLFDANTRKRLRQCESCDYIQESHYYRQGRPDYVWRNDYPQQPNNN